jgi:hypothetical protein
LSSNKPIWAEKEKLMYKFFVGLFIAGLVSFASAQMLGVHAQPFGEGPLFSVEYAQPVRDNLSLTGAVAADFFGGVRVDVGVGMLYTMAEVEGGSVLGTFRVWVPVRGAEDVVVGFSQAYSQFGVMILPEQTGAFTPVFEAGASSPLEGAFSQWPGVYLRAGLVRVF